MNTKDERHAREGEADMSNSELKIHETQFDEALEMVGSWGLWQKTMAVLISLFQLVSAMNNVSAVFISAPFDHRCKRPFEDQTSNFSDFLNNISYPLSDPSCQIFSHNFSGIASHLSEWSDDVAQADLTPFLSNQTVQCQEWNYHSEYFGTSTVSEWNLVCSNKFLKATTQSTYMTGILIGSALFGQLSDRFGRRPTLLFCVVSLSICSFVVAFANTFLLFLFLRFCVALLCGGFMVCNFVLIMEITKPEARTMTGMLNGIPFGLGISVISCFAYFLREWRLIQLSLGVFSTLYFVYFWILPESPRWLVSKGRYQEAVTIMKGIAKWNKKDVPKDEDLLALLVEPSDMETGTKKSLMKKCTSVMADQFTLVRTPILRRRCLISFFAWFASSTVYYGMIFDSANTKTNIYFNVFISGIMEVPAFVLTTFFLYKFGRRLVSCSLFFACSIFLLILVGIPTDQLLLTLIVTSIGKGMTTSVFQLCYLFTSELVPTGVRNMAVGMSSMIARIGSSIAPYIIDGLGGIHYVLPYILFSCLSLVAGLLSLLLPETRNKILPQTIEEVEAKKK